MLGERRTLEDVRLKHAIGVDALQGILDRRIDPEGGWAAIETLEVVVAQKARQATKAKLAASLGTTVDQMT